MANVKSSSLFVDLNQICKIQFTSAFKYFPFLWKNNYNGFEKSSKKVCVSAIVLFITVNVFHI